MRTDCCVCQRNIKPEDNRLGTFGEVSHGYCPSCRTWAHEFGVRQLAGDPAATEEEFNHQVGLRRLR
jgi:hypothetical protein